MLLAERARKSKAMTIPDQLEQAYGSKVAVGGALYVFVKTVPAAYILMFGILLQLLFGWDLWVGIVVTTVVSTGYVLAGGFRAVVKTDWIQFSLMYGSFVVMVGMLFAKFGGLSFVTQNAPDTHFVWHGGQSVGYVISWYFIALSTLIEPAFYQRCFAAKTPATARKGLLISILFWFSFDFMTTATGIYSRAILGDGIRGVEAFPLLADKILPIGLKGMFLIGLATTIQSTVDSYSFIAATTLGRDVLWRVERIRQRIGQVGLSRWGLVASGVVAIAIAMATESVVDIWHRLGSIATPGLLLPLAISYSQRYRYRPRWAMANLIINPVLVGGWFIGRAVFDNVTLFNLTEPIYVGIGLSLLFLAVDHLTRKR